MPDYKNGKIYKVWSPEGDDIYIGSTVQPLYKRFHTHKVNTSCRSKILFEKYDDVRIELIECVPCDNKEQLTKKEGEYIRNNNCVNKQIAGRTMKEYCKEYRENNKDKISEYKKEWHENNKEKIKEKMKEYSQKKITCVCGRTITLNHKARHERSKFHQDAIGGVSAGEDLTS